MIVLPRVSLLPVFVQEFFSKAGVEREPEPEVMDDIDHVEAFTHGGRMDGPLSAMYLFNSSRISQVIQGCKTVIDLGCGPATQLAQVAELNPHVRFIGVDLSAPMLSEAEAYIKDRGLKNIDLVEDDVTRLDKFSGRKVDGMISTFSFHHLPTRDDLSACFKSIRRVLNQNAALYLTDFGRLKRHQSMEYFAYMNEARQPKPLTIDALRSLKAAFALSDYQALCADFFANATTFSTFRVPFMVVIKTADKPPPPGLKTRLADMRQALAGNVRKDLDELSFFFWMGGLRNNLI